MAAYLGPSTTYLPTSQVISDQKITLQNIKNNTGGRYARGLRCTWCWTFYLYCNILNLDPVFGLLFRLLSFYAPHFWIIWLWKLDGLFGCWVLCWVGGFGLVNGYYLLGRLCLTYYLDELLFSFRDRIWGDVYYISFIESIYLYSIL